MQRPFFNSRISELEEELARCSNDIERLRTLLHELGFRSTDKARSLKGQVVEALSRLERSFSPPPPRSDWSRPTPPRVSVESSASALPAQDRPVPHVTNAPEAILDAWTALEVLSPPNPIRRPEDLAGGDRQAVAWLDRERLPWEGGGERARPKTKLFYQIVLGTVDLGAATARLLARYADFRVEPPQVRGEAMLAVVIVDRAGRLAEAPAVSISSFAWGVPRALRDDLSALAGWRQAERPLVEGLDEILRRTHEEGDDEEDLPLDRAALDAGWEWLVASLGLPRDIVAPPRFAIRCFEYFKSSEPPEPLLVNSFFLHDLDAAKTHFLEASATPNLRRYLGCDAPATRWNLLHDAGALQEAVAPGLLPPARWPGPERHSLVLLQQAAVNLAFQELKDNGILAVNGPPGTGKTTLLRDLVAGIVTSRAEAMAGFDDPVTAFIHSGERLKAGAAWLHLYRLDARLKGFEMIVASSNNKAVENVSAALPDLKAIAADADDLRYFRTLSDSLLQRQTWGLVAAVLGKAANRGRFSRTFWWDDDVGFSKYLAEAAGTPQIIEAIDSKTGNRESRPPSIVTKEDPPRNHEEALKRWQQARTSFRTLLEKSRRNLTELEQQREMAASLPTLAREEADAVAAVAAARDAEASAQRNIESFRASLVEAKREFAAAEEELKAYDRTSPSFLARLFRTRMAREWRTGRTPVAKACERAQEICSQVIQAKATSEEQLRSVVAKREAAERQRNSAADRHARVRSEVAAARERIGDRFVDADFFARQHAEKHKIAPWLRVEQQRNRDDVFVAAMALHRAFIDLAARPLRHNLGVLMNTFGGRPLPTVEKRALILDLWSSLFLVVPLISTTFASVERMLGDLPAEALGWLFVDEAGQALPQAAVGALMRTRRAVIVGDPVQIEPIVVLPETLTHAICRQFGVDPDRFNAPNASVQTLADAATPYYAEFEGRQGSRTVGVPLLVHRRCAEPMFGISNAVAYDRLMINATAPSGSRIGEVLGPSAWIDIRGSAVDKWCPEEGEAVLSLLRRLAAAKIDPDLYIVTPFVIVADNLRRLVRESEVLSEWTADARSWVSERIGTVHTVQGREAEAVIFVLGAPAYHQTGARGWAGGKPNLLNVAVTRAKERLYVVGNRVLWREAGLFRELDARL
jgi:AAA domain-containing protein